MSHGLIMPHEIMGETDLFKWTSINVSEERGSVEVHLPWSQRHGSLGISPSLLPALYYHEICISILMAMS